MDGYQGKEVGGRTGSGNDTYTLLILCIKQTTDEKMQCSMGTMLNALWTEREGNPEMRGLMYTYS